MRCLPMVAAAAVVVAGLGASGVASAGAASAAPCGGSSCAGLDPATTGCNQYSGTHAETDGAYAAVVDWYSTGCNANWAQAWLTEAGINAGYRIEVSINTSDSSGQAESMCYPNPVDDPPVGESCVGFYGGSTVPAYTDMVDGTNRTYAYVTVVDSNGNYVTEYTASQ